MGQLGRLLAASYLAMAWFRFGVRGYLDPGTGSFALQMLVAGALGAAFAIKRFWWRITAFFSRKPAGTERARTGEAHDRA